MTVDQIQFMVDILRLKYPLEHLNTPQDLVQLIYEEFSVEVTVDEVKDFCIADDEAVLIYRSFQV